MFDKMILVTEKQDLQLNFKNTFFSYKKDEIDLKNLLESANFSFISRSVTEEDVSKKQIIPYILIKDNNDRFFIYKRKGNEKRLHGLYSVGVGGHIDKEDIENEIELRDLLDKRNNNFFKLDHKKFFQILNIVIKREIYEEIGIILDEKKIENLQFLGIINEDISSVGKVHLGFVFIYKYDNNIEKIKPIDDEIDYFEFASINEIYDKWESFEKWSILALSLIDITKTLIYISFNKLNTIKKINFFKDHQITEFIEFITKDDDSDKFKVFIEFFLSLERKRIYFFIEKDDYPKIKDLCNKFNLTQLKD